MISSNAISKSNLKPKKNKNSEDVSLVDIHAPNNPNSRANLWAESCPYQQLLLVDVIIYIPAKCANESCKMELPVDMVMWVLITDLGSVCDYFFEA